LAASCVSTTELAPVSSTIGTRIPLTCAVTTVRSYLGHKKKGALRFVASQSCLVCGRQPSDPHHLRFAQPRALGLKVSDEFTVPLCRGHHRQLHQAGNEVAWWKNLHINALEIANGLWEQTRPKSAAAETQQPNEIAAKAPKEN
jgi:hypothetical protein